jgi:hypothetical protein
LAEATPSSRGFRWFTRKPLDSLVDPQSQDRRTEDEGAAGPTGLTDEEHQFDHRSPETSKRRTHVRITRLASRLSKFAVARHSSDGAMTKIFEFALEGHVPLVS